MKYVWIIVAVVILVRIDLVLKFFEKTANKFERETSSEVQSSDITPGIDLVPLDKDLAIKSNPRQIFLTMLNDFQANPESETKIKVIEFLKSNPTMFNERLDPDLESGIYRWRTLVVQRNKETAELLLEMLKIFKGENLEMVKRFFSFVIDADMADFLAIYSKSPDVNCMIITYLGDQLSTDERFNELSERLTVLDSYLGREGLAPGIKLFGDKCRLLLNFEVEKMKASFQPAPAEEPTPPSETPVTTDPGLSP